MIMLKLLTKMSLLKNLMLSLMFGFVGAMSLSVSASSNGQYPVLTYKEGQTLAKANINEMKWLEGLWRWQGDVQGPKTGETVLLSAVHKQMGGFARGYDAKGLMFNEIITLSQVDDGLVFTVKHFSPELHGWEPQNKPIQRRLLKREDKVWYFDTVTYVQIDKDKYMLYILLPDDEGGSHVVAIPHSRIKS